MGIRGVKQCCRESLNIYRLLLLALWPKGLLYFYLYRELKASPICTVSHSCFNVSVHVTIKIGKESFCISCIIFLFLSCSIFLYSWALVLLNRSQWTLQQTGMTEVAPFWGRICPQAACVGSRCQERSPLNQLGAGREKVPCPASHPSGLLICRMTLFPPMASASAPAHSNGSFAQKQSLHQDHAWSSASGEPGSPGQPSRGRVVNGSVMEVFLWPRVLAREAAARWAALER